MVENPMLEAIFVDLWEQGTADVVPETVLDERQQARVSTRLLSDRAFYLRLAPEQGRRLMNFCLDAFEPFASISRYSMSNLRPTRYFEEMLPRRVAISLAMWQPASLAGCFKRIMNFDFLGNDDYWLFRGADEATRDCLLNEVEARFEDEYFTRRALLALAWIGDDVVVKTFHRWTSRLKAEERKNHPLTYRIPPFFDAGWQLMDDGTRRNLVYETCYPMVPLDHPLAGRPPGPVRIMTDAPGQCGVCQLPLVSLFEFDLTDPRLSFLRLNGRLLRMPICFACYWNTTAFYEVDTEGGCRWSALNLPYSTITLPDPGTREPVNPLVLATQPVSPFEGFLFNSSASSCAPYQNRTVTQIGGHATWIQGMYYPACPKCHLLMKLIGQLENAYVFDAEGISYAYLCPECMISSTIFQQT